MDSKKKILAIIINYNGIADTLECILSLQKQTYPVSILVVDNGSNVNEGKLIKEKYNEVEVIYSKDNLGFSGGNNLGINYARENKYDYVLLINNDTVVEKNMLCELLKKCDDNRIAVPKMYYYSSPDILWYAGGYINKHMGTAYHIGKKHKDKGQYDSEELCDFATGCCMLIPIGVFERVGLLDDKYFMYYEDVDFSIRLLKNNFQIIYCPHAKLWHKISRSAGNEDSAFSIYYMTRNRLMTINKHKDFFSIEALGGSILTRCVRMVQMGIKGKRESLLFLRAILDYYRGISGSIEINV